MLTLKVSFILNPQDQYTQTVVGFKAERLVKPTPKDVPDQDIAAETLFEKFIQEGRERFEEVKEEKRGKTGGETQR